MDFAQKLKDTISQTIENSFIDVQDLTGEGNHIELILVSSRFENLSRIARQQLVMAQIKELWASGLHALTMKTWTPSEWETQKKI